MRRIGHESLQAAVGWLKLIGKGSLFTFWACMSTSFSSCSVGYKLFWPMRWSHAALHFAQNGPMLVDQPNAMALAIGPCKAFDTRACRMLWASSSSSARAAYSHFGPAQALRLAAVPLAANYSGPHKGLGMRDGRLLWAGFSASARGNLFILWA